MDTNPKDVNDLHNESDVDSGDFSQHHTLGYGVNQAAPGLSTGRRLNHTEVQDWVNLSPSGSGVAKYCVEGNHVFCEINLTGLSLPNAAATTIVLAANGIPAAYRPDTSYYVGGNGAGTAVVTGLFKTDGSIQVLNGTGTTLNTARFFGTWRI